MHRVYILVGCTIQSKWNNCIKASPTRLDHNNTLKLQPNSMKRIEARQLCQKHHLVTRAEANDLSLNDFRRRLSEWVKKNRPKQPKQVLECNIEQSRPTAITSVNKELLYVADLAPGRCTKLLRIKLIWSWLGKRLSISIWMRHVLLPTSVVYHENSLLCVTSVRVVDYSTFI